MNRALQGHDLPIKGGPPGLFFVGDGVKPKGYVMTEGVAKGSLMVAKEVLKVSKGRS